jgi:ADP-ribosylglycohydrolase
VTNRSSTRARGALLGLAVGDALGTTLEFEATSAPPFPALAAGPHREVTGGGPFRVAPGQVTDDTQLAVALFSSLRERGAFVAADVASRYVAWCEHAFDIGGQTRAALDRTAGGIAPPTGGREVWEASGKRAAGNGSLMRTAPIGVFFAGDADARRRAAVDESAITHFDFRCQLACAAFDAAIARAIQGGADLAALMIDAAQTELLAAAWLLGRRWPGDGPAIEAACRNLESDLAAARSDDPDLYGDQVHLHRHQGFVRVAFRLAFWELLHAPSFEAGLIDAVNRGGDADTNGAITGALLGACHGDPAIPDRWLEAVRSALPEQPGAPLTTTYHPRAFDG